MSNNNKDSKKKSPPYVGLGLLFGVAFGSAIDNLGLGISLGIVLGAGMDSKKSKKNDEDKKK